MNEYFKDQIEEDDTLSHNVYYANTDTTSKKNTNYLVYHHNKLTPFQDIKSAIKYAVIQKTLCTLFEKTGEGFTEVCDFIAPSAR